MYVQFTPYAGGTTIYRYTHIILLLILLYFFNYWLNKFKILFPWLVPSLLLQRKHLRKLQITDSSKITNSFISHTPYCWIKEKFCFNHNRLSTSILWQPVNLRFNNLKTPLKRQVFLCTVTLFPKIYLIIS